MRHTQISTYNLFNLPITFILIFLLHFISYKIPMNIHYSNEWVKVATAEDPSSSHDQISSCDSPVFYRHFSETHVPYIFVTTCQ